MEHYCERENKKISQIVYENELVLKSSQEINHELKRVWDTMLECMYIGCHTSGTLPGGLPVRVLRVEDGWAQVNAPHGVRVWIYGKFVSADSGIATVTGSAVRLRSIPSTDASSVVLGEAAKGQRVRVLSVRGK